MSLENLSLRRLWFLCDDSQHILFVTVTGLLIAEWAFQLEKFDELQEAKVPSYWSPRVSEQEWRGKGVLCFNCRGLYREVFPLSPAVTESALIVWPNWTSLMIFASVILNITLKNTTQTMSFNICEQKTHVDKSFN